MKALETALLINEVTALALVMIAQPLADDLSRPAAIRDLDAKVEAALVGDPTEARFLGNAAPILIDAMARLQTCRKWHDSDGAAHWESAVGVLIPIARRDAGKAFDSVND